MLGRAPVLQLPRADVCQQRVTHRAAASQEAAKGSPNHGHTGARRALTPHPGAGLTASPGHILHPVAAECQSPSAPTATGNHWSTSGGSAGMCQGLLWKPWELSWRGKEQRGVQSPVPHPDHSADCPQPHLHTLSQHRPLSEMMWEGPLDDPTTLTPTGRAGAATGLWGLCSCSHLPHAPAGLNTCYSRQGKPLPRSIPQIHRKTDSLTGMQRTSGQAGHTISVTG